MNSQVGLIPIQLQVLPQNTTLDIEIDSNTTIQELMEYIKNDRNLGEDINKWTCYSQAKRQYLELKDFLGTNQFHKLIINTAPTAKLQMNDNSNLIKADYGSSNTIAQQNQELIQNNNNFVQSNVKNQPFQQQQYCPQNQIINGQQPQIQSQNQNIHYNNFIDSQNNYKQQIDQGEISLININFKIIDGNVPRSFKATFKNHDLLENLADSVLQYLGVTKEVASCDLYISNQIYNNPQKREKTLLQLQIKNELTVDARIRWIGGCKY